ncbi:MAG TPA: YitT family protein [Acholeplasmataceae bacterium]|nr:YitT family protein [Acholeplasmataceae bacterium]
MKKNNFFKSLKFKTSIGPEIFRIFIVIISTIIYGIGLGWFIEASSVRTYAGGIPGIAQLIADIVKLSNNGELAEGTRSIIMFIAILGLNIPIFILGWFGVSKRFTIYSIISVTLQAIIIGYIKVDIFKGVEPSLLAVFGGALIGLGIGIAMKFGTSTGGFDVVSQYISLKKGRSVGRISTGLNLVIAVVGAILYGVEAGVTEAGLILLYTLLTLFATMIVIDQVHTTYKYIEFNIITDQPEEMAAKIIEVVKRGVTILDGRGGYTLQDRSMIYLIVMNFERHKLLTVVKSVDPDAFIVSKPVASISGNFWKKTVA